MTPTERVAKWTAGLRAGRTAEAMARETGASPQEIELLQALFAATMQEQEARAARRRVQVVGVLAAVLAGLTFVVTGPAWAQSCPQTLPAPMVTFCPESPAMASQVNANFQQLATWLIQKTGPLGSNNVVVNGTLTVNGADGGVGTGLIAGNPSLSGNLSLDGGISFGANLRQHLNLWNAEYGLGVQASTLYLRSASNFGFYVGGAHSNGVLDPGGGATMLKILATGETIGRGQYQLNTAAPVPYEVSMERFVVEAGPSRVGAVVPIDQTVLRRLCGDLDGCPYTLSMVNWDGNNRVATRSGTLFAYEGNSQTWRLEIVGNDVDGNDNDNALQEASAWDCYLTDAETAQDTNNGRRDQSTGFGLLNCRGCNYSDTSTTCRLVLRD